LRSGPRQLRGLFRLLAASCHLRDDDRRQYREDDQHQQHLDEGESATAGAEMILLHVHVDHLIWS
jgi:hypothetical protein